MKPVKIIHAETNALIREGLKTLLANEDLAFSIKGTDNKDNLNNLLKSSNIDLLIFGYGSSIDFNKSLVKEIKLKHPEIKILIIANDMNKSHVLQLLDYGIDGYLTNRCDINEIKNAIRTIINNDKFFCNSVINILL